MFAPPDNNGTQHIFNNMRIVRLGIIIISIVTPAARAQYSFTPLHEYQCRCQGYSKSMRSIIVKDTR